VEIKVEIMSQQFTLVA